MAEQRLDALGVIGIVGIEQLNAATYSMTNHFQADVGVVDPAVQRSRWTLITPLADDLSELTEIHR